MRTTWELPELLGAGGCGSARLPFDKLRAGPFNRLRTGHCGLRVGSPRTGGLLVSIARRTPHRFRPKTPEPASPLGEGEEWCRPHRRTVMRRAVVARRTPHQLRPKTPESLGGLGTGSASPLGETFAEPRDGCPGRPSPQPSPTGRGGKSRRNFEDSGDCAKVSLERGRHARPSDSWIRTPVLATQVSTGRSLTDFRRRPRESLG